MSRSSIVHAVATCAIVLVLTFMMMSCARVPLHDTSENMSGDYEMDMNAVGVDDGGETAAPEPPPPPPPPPTPPLAPPPASGSGGPHERCCDDAVAAPPRTYATAARARAGYAAPANQAFAGLGAFVKPPVWTVGQTYTLKFVVGENDAGLAAISQGQALTGRSRIWMAPTMRVTLDPHPDFAINPQNAEQEVQQLSPEGTANWFWTVIPRRAGKFTLVARVQAVTLGPDGEPLLDAQGRPRGRFYPAQQVEVKVKVGAREGAMNAIRNTQSFGEAFTGLFKTWEGTLGALAALITAAGLVWAAIRKLQGKPVRPRIRRRKKA